MLALPNDSFLVSGGSHLMNNNENLLQSGFHQVSASQTNRHTHFLERSTKLPFNTKISPWRWHIFDIRKTAATGLIVKVHSSRDRHKTWEETARGFNTMRKKRISDTLTLKGRYRSLIYSQVSLFMEKTVNTLAHWTKKPPESGNLGWPWTSGSPLGVLGKRCAPRLTYVALEPDWCTAGLCSTNQVTIPAPGGHFNSTV